MMNPKKSFHIPYHEDYLFEAVDMDKLRPGKSYSTLFNNRDYMLETILDEFGQVPPELLETVPCPLCHSKDHVWELEKDSFQLVKCTNCECVFVNPRLTPAAYVQTYKSNNYGHIINELALSSHDYRKLRFGVERINQIEKFARPDSPKSLLDIGSASGFFLESAKEKGWEVLGIELSPPAIEFSRSRGLDILEETFDEIDFGSRKFTVITMFDVLEHLPNPATTIHKIKNLLNPGGLLYLYIPNWNSASRLILGTKAHFIWPTHHLTYFTPKTITSFLEKHDFSVERIETNGLDIEDWIWQLSEQGENTDTLESKKNELQFLINSSLWGKNLRVLARV